jgi:hypothetical protein
MSIRAPAGMTALTWWCVEGPARKFRFAVVWVMAALAGRAENTKPTSPIRPFNAFVPVVSVEREVSVERRLKGRVRQLRALPHEGPAAESRQLVAHGLI